MMGTILAYITFAGAMGGAVYLLANDKPLYGLAALVTVIDVYSPPAAPFHLRSAVQSGAETRPL